MEVETAKANKSKAVTGLLDAAKRRRHGCDGDDGQGYDVGPVYEDCPDRDSLPIIPLREIGAVKAGKHLPPECKHGTWTFTGSDRKREVSRWRCPTGKCKPASPWVAADRLHPLTPRD